MIQEQEIQLYNHTISSSSALHGDRAALVVLIARHWEVPPIVAIMELRGNPFRIAPAAARAILRQKKVELGTDDLDRLVEVWEIEERAWTLGVQIETPWRLEAAREAQTAGSEDHPDSDQLREQIMASFAKRREEASQAYPSPPKELDPLSEEAINQALEMLPVGAKPPLQAGERFRGMQELASEAREGLRKVGHPWDVVRQYFRRVDPTPLEDERKPSQADLERIAERINIWSAECEKMAAGGVLHAGALHIFFSGPKCFAIRDSNEDPVEILNEIDGNKHFQIKMTTAHRMVLDQRFAAGHESGIQQKGPEQ